MNKSVILPFLNPNYAEVFDIRKLQKATKYRGLALRQNNRKTTRGRTTQYIAIPIINNGMVSLTTKCIKHER